MMFTELFVPHGVFTADELSRLAGRLTLKQLLTHAEALRDVADAGEAATADPGVVDYLDSISHVVVHEPATWIAGGHATGPAEPPRYVVRVSVPGPWRKAMSAFLVASITRVLAQASPDPGRYYREPLIEVHVTGVPEGGYGLSGWVVGESALLDMISDARTGGAVPDDPGVLVDPVCGMAASDRVKTLEHGGTTYGFCSPGCRRHFAGKLAGDATR